MDSHILNIIVGMGLVTYLPRMLPLVGLSKVELPPLLLRWLKYIPAAVMASLLVPSILMPEGELYLGLNNLYLLAALPTFAVALKTRSLGLTVLAGMLAVVILQYLL